MMLTLRLIAGTILAFSVFAMLCLLGLGPVAEPLRAVVALALWMALSTALLAEAGLAIFSVWLVAALVFVSQSAVLWGIAKFSRGYQWSDPSEIFLNAAALLAAYFALLPIQKYLRPKSRFAAEELQKIKETRPILDQDDPPAEDP